MLTGLHLLGGGGQRWRDAYAAAGIAEYADAAVKDPQQDGTHRWAVRDLDLLCEAIIVLHGADGLRAAAAHDKRQSINGLINTVTSRDHSEYAERVAGEADVWPGGHEPGSLSAGVREGDPGALSSARELLSSAQISVFDRWVEATGAAPVTEAVFGGRDLSASAGIAVWELADRGIDVDRGVLGRAARSLSAYHWSVVGGTARELIVGIAFETMDHAVMRNAWNPATPVGDNELLEAAIASGPVISMNVFNAAAQRPAAHQQLCELIGAGELSLNGIDQLTSAALLSIAASLAPYGHRVDVGALHVAAGDARKLSAGGLGTVTALVGARNAYGTYSAAELAHIISGAGLTMGSLWAAMPPATAAAILDSGAPEETLLRGIAQCAVSYQSAVLDAANETTRAAMYLNHPQLAAGISETSRDAQLVRDMIVAVGGYGREHRYELLSVACSEINAGRFTLCNWLWELLQGGGRDMLGYSQLRQHMQMRLSATLASATQWQTAMTMLAESDTLTCEQVVDCVRLLDAA